MSLSHLRPLAFGEILDGAFVIYRRHFATLFATALIPLLPVAVLWGVFGYVTAGTSAETLEAGTWLVLLFVYPVMLVGMVLMWGALIHETGEAVTGGPVDRGEAFRVAFRRMLPMIGAGILFTILAGLGFVLLVVPGFLVMIMLFAVQHVVVIEGKGPVEALSRSRDLARGAWWRIVGIWVVSTLIVMIPGMIVGMVSGVAMIAAVMSAGGDPAAAEGATAWISAVYNVLSMLFSALTTPYMVAALTVLYYDRRVRTDALDLEMATERLASPV